MKVLVRCKHPLQSLEHRRDFQLVMQEPRQGVGFVGWAEM